MEQQRAHPGATLVALRPYRGMIIASVVVMMLAALAYSSRGEDVYSASSRVVVRPVLIEGTRTPQDVFEGASDPFGLSALSDTQVELVLSQAVGDRVAEVVSPQTLGATSVTAKAITSDVITIDSSARDPRAAIRVVNAYASAFLGERREIVSEALSSAVQDLDAKIDTLTMRSEELAAELAALPDGEEHVGPKAQLKSVFVTLATLTTRRDQLAFDVGQHVLR